MFFKSIRSGKYGWVLLNAEKVASRLRVYTHYAQRSHMFILPALSSSAASCNIVIIVSFFFSFSINLSMLLQARSSPRSKAAMCSLVSKVCATTFLCNASLPLSSLHIDLGRCVFGICHEHAMRIIPWWYNRIQLWWEILHQQPQLEISGVPNIMWFSIISNKTALRHAMKLIHPIPVVLMLLPCVKPAWHLRSLNGHSSDVWWSSCSRLTNIYHLFRHCRWWYRQALRSWITWFNTPVHVHPASWLGQWADFPFRCTVEVATECVNWL